MVKSNYITITNLRTNTYKLLSASIDYYIDFDCRYDCIVCINFNRAINRCLIIFRKIFSMSPSDDGNLSITKFLCVCVCCMSFFVCSFRAWQLFNQRYIQNPCAMCVHSSNYNISKSYSTIHFIFKSSKSSKSSCVQIPVNHRFIGVSNPSKSFQIGNNNAIIFKYPQCNTHRFKS